MALIVCLLKVRGQIFLYTVPFMSSGIDLCIFMPTFIYIHAGSGGYWTGVG